MPETRDHNSKDTAAVIKKAALEVGELIEERAIIQDKIREAKGRVRELGITMTDFNVALRLQRLEVEDRNQALDSMRICFEALELGAQSEMFSREA